MKLFCEHEYKEIGRYYKEKFSTRFGNELEIYKVYQCDKCNKEIHKKVFEDSYSTYGTLLSELDIFKKWNYISEKEYVCK